MKNSVKKLFFIIALFTAINANSSTNVIFDQLSRDKLTILDWGLLKIEDSIDDIVVLDFYFSRRSINAYYSSNERKIKISFNSFIDDKTVEEYEGKYELLCMHAMKVIKERLGYPLSSLNFGINQFFSHKDDRKNQASDHEKQLAKNTLINIRISHFDEFTLNGIFGNISQCQSILSDKDVNVTKK